MQANKITLIVVSTYLPITTPLICTFTIISAPVITADNKV